MSSKQEKKTPFFLPKVHKFYAILVGLMKKTAGPQKTIGKAKAVLFETKKRNLLQN